MIAGSPTSSRRHGRLLLVDGLWTGDADLAPILRRHGYEIDVAGSAREALLLARTGRWDAVLLSVGLPDLDGVELYPLPLSARGQVPLIFVSSYTRSDLLRSLRQATPAARESASGAVRTFLATLERSLVLSESEGQKEAAPRVV